MFGLWLSCCGTSFKHTQALTTNCHHCRSWVQDETTTSGGTGKEHMQKCALVSLSERAEKTTHLSMPARVESVSAQHGNMPGPIALRAGSNHGVEMNKPQPLGDNSTKLLGSTPSGTFGSPAHTTERMQGITMAFGGLTHSTQY